MKKSSILGFISFLLVSEVFAFPPETAQFGTGFDSLGQRELAQGCVRRDSEIGVSQRTSGQRVDFSMSHITSLKSLKRELGIEAHASLGVGVFSGDCRVEYVNSEDFNEFSTFMTLKVKVENQTQSLNRFILSDWASSLLMKRGPMAFFQTCGDSFVAGEKSGGEMVAVVSFTTRSSEQKRKLVADINSSAVFFRASGSLSDALRNYAKNTEHTVKIFREGACGALPDWDHLEQAFRDFPEQVRPGEGHAWVVDAVVRPYYAVENVPGTIQIADMEQQKYFLHDLVDMKDQLLVLRNNIKQVVAHPDRFNKPELDINDAFRRVNTLIDKLGKQAMQCIQVPERSCKPDASIQIPQVQLPKERTIAWGTERPAPTSDFAEWKAKIRDFWKKETNLELEGLQLNMAAGFARAWGDFDDYRRRWYLVKPLMEEWARSGGVGPSAKSRMLEDEGFFFGL